MPVVTFWCFGYISISLPARAVLNETYDYPSDFDQPTRELCEECAEICSGIPKGSVPMSISWEAWQNM